MQIINADKLQECSSLPHARIGWSLLSLRILQTQDQTIWKKLQGHSLFPLQLQGIRRESCVFRSSSTQDFLVKFANASSSGTIISSPIERAQSEICFQTSFNWNQINRIGLDYYSYLMGGEEKKMKNKTAG